MADTTATDAAPASETRTLDFGHTRVELVRDPTDGRWALSETAAESARATTVKEYDFGCTRVRMVRDVDAEDGWIPEDLPQTPAAQRVHA